MNRIQQLMQVLPKEIDAVLITSPVNRKYYTGLSSSAGTILATRDKAWFLIDSRYVEVATNTISSCEVLLQEKLMVQLSDLLQQAGAKTLAVEAESTSLQTFATYQKELGNVELIGDKILSEAINKQRCIKSAEEINFIKQAQEISDQTFDYIIQRIEAGRTEREIALDMEFYSRKLGSEGPAFSFIVVSGKNSSLPHGVPSEKKVEKGDLITMDFGSIINGYRSDMTRTVAVGEISDKQRDVYETVLRAQLSSMERVRAGEICNQVDKVARDIIESSPYKGCFGHGLGHALGLQVHEEPRFNPTDTTVLEPGMILSVEPGIYIPGEFGVRIEDIVAITENGFENLVCSTKELLVL